MNAFRINITEIIAAKTIEEARAFFASETGGEEIDSICKIENLDMEIGIQDENCDVTSSSTLGDLLKTITEPVFISRDE